MDTIFTVLAGGCLGGVFWSGWNYLQFLKLKERDWQSDIEKFLNTNTP